MSNPQHEPTMEEILASIRKIISEDSTDDKPVAPAPQPEAPAPAPVMLEPEADDILELTDEIVAEPALEVEAELPPAFEDAPGKADEIVFASIDEVPAQVREPEPEIREVIHAPAPAADARIFNDQDRMALDDAFATIESENEPPASRRRASSRPTSAGGGSVEDVFDRAVREAFDPVLRDWLDGNTSVLVEHIRPVIREWLDEHFQPMLEEAVRSEVARAAEARRR